MWHKFEQFAAVVASIYRCWKYRSVKAIANYAWKRCAAQDRDSIRQVETVDNMVMYYHNTAGRRIRNRYGLWNPRHNLTRNFFTDGDKYVRDGINYHPQHPDAVSTEVLKEMWNISRNK